MFKYFIGLLCALSLSGLVFAQDEPRDYYGYEWFTDNVHFTYSPELGESIRTEHFPPSTETDVPGGALPEYTQLSFERYDENTGWADTGGVIQIYPISTFPDADQPATQVLEQIQALIESDTIDFGENLPSINQLTTPQVFAVQREKIDFQNGSGFRFVTAGTFDVGPIINGMVYYNFQGITEDGSYLVAASFPVSASSLPDEAEPLEGEAYNEFSENYPEYLQELTTTLDALSPDQFTPSLDTLDALIQSLNVESPMATVELGETNGEVDAEGLSFTVDPSLATRIEVDTVEAVTGEEAANTMYGESPEYTTFTLANYPLPQSYIPPQLTVFKVEDFPNVEGVFDNELTRLQTLLTDRPELQSRGNTESPALLPMLPPLNAAQIIVSQPEYLDFENGSGVRYLTYYAQDVSPILNRGFFYTFQGLTEDGQTVVTAQFPISTTVLADDFNPEGMDYDAFAAGYNQYLSETVAQLDALSPDEFTPSLDTLDALIASIRVE